MTEDGVPLASYGSRVVGFIIDHILVSTLAIVGVNLIVDDFWSRWVGQVRVYIEGAATGQPIPTEFVHLAQLAQISVVVVGLVYGVVCLLTMSASVGQRVMGLRVAPVDEGKKKLSVTRAILRTLLWVISGTLLWLQALSLLMPLWQPRRQALHDLLSRTQVVKRVPVEAAQESVVNAGV